MVISLKHNFQSAIADEGDTSLVRPSNWNAEHDLTLATSRLVGRTTAGTGSAEEISVGTGLSLSSGSLAVSSTTPQVNSINTFTAAQVIEVTDNSNAALRITQLGTGNAILVEDSSNPDNTPFVVSADGNVVIGATTTASKLEVLGGVVNSVSNLGSEDAATVTITNTDVSGLGRISKTLYTIGNLPVAAVAAVYSAFNGGGDIGGDLVFGTQTNLAGGVVERLRISNAGVTTITGTGVVASNSSGTAFRVTQTGSGNAFVVEDSSNPDSSPFVVTAEGRVGIGEDVPSFYLQVAAPDASTQTQMGITSANYTSDFKSLYMVYSDSSTTGTTYGISNANLGSIRFQNTSNALIGTNGGTPLIFGTLSLERMRIASDGKVGIGTTAPDALLSVNGVASFGAGSAAAPSVAGFGDLNTGMFFPAADTIAFSTNGTEDFRIGSAGQLGIGGANYGTSTQYMKSGGASAAPSWATISSTDVSGLGTLATQSGTFSGTSSGTNTGDQNLFSTIAVSGQSDVVADSTSDTLTLVAGTNVTITTDAGTDTITIASSGGGASPLTLVDTTTFDSSGTYTVPAGANIFKVHMWGGGGSGGEGSSGAPGGGGGGGAFVEAWFGSVTLAGASTLAVVVGAGGAAQTSSNSAGNVGGTTTIGGATGNFLYFRAFGGGGGGQNSSGGGGGGGGGNDTAGGTGSGTVAGTAGGGSSTRSPNTNNMTSGSYLPFSNAYSINGFGAIPTFGNAQSGTRFGAGTAGGTGSVTGAPGVDTNTVDKILTNDGSDTFAGGAGGGGGRDGAGSAAVNRGGNALWGGAGGGGAATSVVGGNGGTSTYGGAGGAGAVDANNATAGSQPGGGGGGSEAGNSGAGGAGRVIIYAYNFA